MNYPNPNNTRFLASLPVVFLAVLLTACGGGGGGSNSSSVADGGDDKPDIVPIVPIVPTPAPVTVTDKPDIMPIAPTPATPVITTNPPATLNTPVTNAVVANYSAGTNTAAGQVYASGTTDKYYMSGCSPVTECYSDGRMVANVLQERESVYPDGVIAGFRRIEGATNFDPSLTVPSPPDDVRQAWRDGWTGQGVNVLIADDFGTPNRFIVSGDDRGTHGYTVGMAAVLEVNRTVRIYNT